MVPSFAFAQLWDELITTKSNTKYLIDPASIQKTGDIVKYAQLSNHPNGYASDNQSIHSIQQVKEIDCKNKMIKTVSMIAYEGENAKGGILNLSVGQDYQWAKVNQNSVSSIYMSEVCK